MSKIEGESRCHQIILLLNQLYALHYIPASTQKEGKNFKGKFCFSVGIGIFAKLQPLPVYAFGANIFEQGMVFLDYKDGFLVILLYQVCIPF